MKTIIEMAKEAGLIVDANQSGFDSVEAFAALARADEREACAALVQSNAEACGTYSTARRILESNAAAIRARGNT